MCWRTALSANSPSISTSGGKPDQPFRVHICTLAHAYGESLAKGELSIGLKEGRPRVKHFDNSWPLGPASWGALLGAEDSGCFAELDRLLAEKQVGAEERAALSARGRAVQSRCSRPRGARAGSSRR